MRIDMKWVTCALVLAACAAFAGSALRTGPGTTGLKSAATGDVSSSRSRLRPPLPASIDLVGHVEGHGGATSGTITVRIGTAEAATAGTIAPQFHASVTSARAQDMVTIEIEAPGLKFTSILGSYGRLVKLAGSDRVLTLDECDALRVSPLSTALQFFVSRQLAGDPLSDVQHESAWRAIVSGDFSSASGVGLDTATVLLGRFATDELTLPPGYAHGYALLQDQDAYRSFVNDSPNALDEHVDDLDSLTPTAMSDRDLKPMIATLGAIKDAKAPLFGGDVEILQRTASGYRVHAEDSRRNPDFSGGLDAVGRLQLEPAGEISTITYVSCPNGTWTVRKTSLLGQSHRLQRRGMRSNLWMTINDYLQIHPDCPDYPPVAYRTATFRVALDLAATIPSADARRFHGTRGLPYISLANSGGPGPTNYLERREYALHRFDRAGTGLVTGLGPKVDSAMEPINGNGSASFTWNETAQSAVRVQFPDVSTRYWIVDAGNGTVTGLVFLAEAMDGQNTTSLAGRTSMIDGNVAGGFSSPVGAWKYASFEQYIEPYAYNDDTEFWQMRFTRTADGRAVRRDWSPASEFTSLWSWSLINGRLYDTRIYSDAGRHYNCDEAYADGATYCAPFMVRYFRPLTSVGNRLYGIEDIYVNMGELQASPPYSIERSSRGTYHEIDALSVMQVTRR